MTKKATTDPAFTALDRSRMRAALGLARRGLGRVWPNPAVGCILIREDMAGAVVGRGWTQPGGRPHAETEALTAAGDLARGATAYVTLEPCSHQGQTGPCADALIAAGVTSVIAAVNDPDPRVSGGGIEKLRLAGIDVQVGLLADIAERLNSGFFRRVRDGRPQVTLKLATTLDGRIALAGGDSKWITGEAARQRGHLLRATNDAVLTGIGTIKADDPELTCRLPGMADRRPLRIVLDAKGETPKDAKIFKSDAPVLIVCAADSISAFAALRLAGKNVEVIAADTDADRRIDPAAVLQTLGKRGITRLLVEAGAEVSASFLKAELVDELAWFRAPRIIGGDGLGGVGALAITALGQTPSFKLSDRVDLDGDVLETYVRG